MIAEDYPSPDQPNREVGIFDLHESIQYMPVEVWDTPPFFAIRDGALKKAAAEHGANALFLARIYNERDGRGSVFLGLSLSNAQPVYPSVEEVLAKLHLAEEGYKEAHRFTAAMATLGKRKPEPISLKSGYEYMFVMVFHPGLVDLRLGKWERLVFYVAVENDAFYPFDREGFFTQRIDKSYEVNERIPGVDGVWARGGAGTMEGQSHKLELVSRTATIRLAVRSTTNARAQMDRFGAGEADFIVFERPAPKDKFVTEVCDFCENVARECNKRRPLEACDELRACFKKIEQPISLCSVAYKDI